MADQRETATTETTAGLSERPGDAGRKETPLDPDLDPDTLPAGPELDRLVHTKVRNLGADVDSSCPPYSTDDGLFREIRRVVGFLAIEAVGTGYSARVTLRGDDHAESSWGETRALALCRAGVKAALAAGH